MSKYALARVKEIGEDEAGERVERLQDVLDSNEFEIITTENLRIEELAYYCDSEAEGRNNHDFVNAHKVLGAMLNSHLGQDKATEIMLEIAERGGLDGMLGRDYDTPENDGVWSEFGLDPHSMDWELLA